MAKGGVVGRIPFSFVAIAGLSLAAPASAAQDIGFPGPSYVGSGSFPTGTKPQSKLWFHAGQWWGSLWSEAIRRFTIHRLDTNTQLWTDTGTIIDPRFNSHSDCMSDGNRVYVLTHRFTTDPGLPGNPIGLFRFVYVGAPTRTRSSRGSRSRSATSRARPRSSRRTPRAGCGRFGIRACGYGWRTPSGTT